MIYDGEICLGGAVIEKPWLEQSKPSLSPLRPRHGRAPGRTPSEYRARSYDELAVLIQSTLNLLQHTTRCVW